MKRNGNEEERMLEKENQPTTRIKRKTRAMSKKAKANVSEVSTS